MQPPSPAGSQGSSLAAKAGWQIPLLLGPSSASIPMWKESITRQPRALALLPGAHPWPLGGSGRRCPSQQSQAWRRKGRRARMRNPCNSQKRGCESCRVKRETDTVCNEGSKGDCRKTSGNSRSATGSDLRAPFRSCLGEAVPAMRVCQQALHLACWPVLSLPRPAGIKYRTQSSTFFALMEALLAFGRGTEALQAF